MDTAGPETAICMGLRSEWQRLRAAERAVEIKAHDSSRGFPAFDPWGLPSHVLKVSHILVLGANCAQQAGNTGRAVLLCCCIRGQLKPAAGAGLAGGNPHAWLCSSLLSPGTVIPALLASSPSRSACRCGRGPCGNAPLPLMARHQRTSTCIPLRAQDPGGFGGPAGSSHWLPVPAGLMRAGSSNFSPKVC